jgi:TonB family protein
MRSSLLIALAASLTVSSPSVAQLVIGRVLDKENRAPLRQIERRLVADTGKPSTVLERATTDSSGDFYLDAPAHGAYRLVFALPGSTLLSAPFAVNDDVQHEYLLDTQPARAYFEFEVTKHVSPLPNQPRPRYPEEMRREMIEGEVLVQFVVDTLGQPDMATFKVLRSPHPELTRAVWTALPAMRFSPAEVNNRKVRQVAQAPFDFCLNQRTLQSRPDTLRLWTPTVRPVVCEGR